MMVVTFVCWVAVVALSTAFVLGLASKWGLVEWAQVHAPNDFFEKLLNCKFCLSFWTGLVISLILSVTAGCGWIIAAPICSTVIARELW